MTATTFATLLDSCPDLADRMHYTGCCVLWTGSVDAKGYGRAYTRDQSTTLAHRVVYQRLHGDVGSLAVDHLCYVRSCVNPNHLEAVSPSLNVQRAAERKRRGAALGTPLTTCCGQEAERRLVPRAPRPPSKCQDTEERLRARSQREGPNTKEAYEAFVARTQVDLVLIPLPLDAGGRQRYRVVSHLAPARRT